MINAIIKINTDCQIQIKGRKKKKPVDMELGENHVLPSFDDDNNENDEPDLDEDDQPLIISGYANRALPDRMNELMPPECWDLTDYNKNPVVHTDHMMMVDCLVGTAQVKALPEGLFFKAEIGNPPKAALTPKQITTRSLIRQGYLKGVSVGFIPKDVDYDEQTQILTYKKVLLTEFSLVTVPMQQDSLITSMKSFKEFKDKKLNEYEEIRKELEDLKKDYYNKTSNIHKLELEMIRLTKLIRQLSNFM